jgi:hypothetical protein
MTSLDLDLINERNTQLLHDVRAERLRGRLRTERVPRSVAGRIAGLVETSRMFGLLAGTRRRIDEVAREA